MILLDTHVFLWMCLEPKRLSRRATFAIRRAAASGGFAIASISLWEIAMLVALGRLSPRGTPETWMADLIETSGVVVKELSPAVAVLSTQFPSDFPSDPADRLISATARAEGLMLVTRDGRIRESPLLKTVW
ncbi:MAG: type II toxin-antitoxin system VapC family toxin [Candidatus Binatia bacterium]